MSVSSSSVCRGATGLLVAALAVSASPAVGAIEGPATVAAQCDTAPALPRSHQPSHLLVGVTDNKPAPATQRLLRQLRPHHVTIGVHDYTGPGRSAAYLKSVYPRLHALARSGYPVNLNIADGNGGNGPPSSTSVFVHFVRQVVAHDGRWLSGVEITNEPNVPSPSTSDGANPQIVADLVKGVVAAKQAARARHLSLKVGFNVAYGYGSDPAFWTALRAAATPAFRHDVDYLGLHTYPNLASADTPVNSSTSAAELKALESARCLMTSLGLSRQVPIDITEVGYPTAKGQPEYAAQAEYYRRVLTVVGSYASTYNVRGFYSFLLQDAPSTAAVAGGFGLFTPRGGAKPAERVVHHLYARYAVGSTATSHAQLRARRPPPFVPISYQRLHLPHSIQPWGATWTPDGRHVLFEDQMDGYQTWAVRANGTHLRCITCRISNAPKISGDAGAMVYGFPGNKRLFVSYDTAPAPPADPPTGADAYVVQCQPSIFHCRTHHVLPIDLSADQTTAHPVLFRRTWHLAPDGRHIGWMDVRDDGTMLVVGLLKRESSKYVATDLKVVNPAAATSPTDADPARRVTAGQIFELKSFANGGRDAMIVGEPDSVNPDQELVDLRTGKVTRLTSNVDWDEDGGVSPDGRWDTDASFRSMHGTDVFGMLPETHAFIDLPAIAGLAGYYVSSHAGFQCDLTPWLLPGTGDNHGRLMGQPLGPYDGGTSYIANDFLGQQVWNRTSTKVLLQQRRYGPPRGTRQQAAMGSVPHQLLIAHLHVPPHKPLHVVPSTVGSWAKTPLTYDSGYDIPDTITMHGPGGGTATATYTGNLLSSDDSVTYHGYSDDGRSFVTGTEHIVNPNYLAQPVHWTQDVTLTGQQHGSEHLDLSLNGVKSHGTVTTRLDGTTLSGLPKLGACPNRMPRPARLRLRTTKRPTKSGERIRAVVTASIAGAGQAENRRDTRPVRGAVVRVAGKSARTNRDGIAVVEVRHSAGRSVVVRATAGATFKSAHRRASIPDRRRPENARGNAATPARRPWTPHRDHAPQSTTATGRRRH